MIYPAYGDIYPPTYVCLSSDCPNYQMGVLTDPITYQATQFTLQYGVLPIYTTSMYCCKCFQRYHHNFSVHKSTNTQTYYYGVPSTIQVATHFFIDTPLLELFANAEAFGWLSSMNCAHIYNIALAHSNAYILNNRHAFAMAPEAEHMGKSWPCSLQMQDENVLNGFFIYSLLLDKAEKQSQLILEMEGIYPHACDKCFVVLDNEHGQKVKIQAAVCNGNTIGHPCCAVHDCKMPLYSHWLQFCSDHQNLCSICADEGSKTFHIVEHNKLEEAYYKPAKALFQLHAQLTRAGLSVPSDSVIGDEGEDVGEESTECVGKSDKGNAYCLKARFGTQCTHNEQLIMRPCGIILAWATFYGSEAISAVSEFAKAVFPTPQSTPEYFIFDNNCKLHAHQEAKQDHHFSDTALPVDVFHFNSKHKETDLYCQQHCNPAAFPDLLENGKWHFNTSICEQTNVWLGGYQAILRNMTVHRYNFYLDEMIKRQNQHVNSELKKAGIHTWLLPIAAL
ncbi:hypothetical protein F5J12DRAFT_906966 [Pisolithus orientalis]|uniref:uncharacterized protein n=1 Tax=Pisolithus orientalis TaxID=936130 RepID=UPI0022253C7F|nr:uncharacterized protein F5J12DRAFT_906966 [Pisolithus orientalis]KAI5997233.1 hypothetical protein F5J12DRAFT_906966 [Pisolithus orientalis]